ncbi:MAG: hypothetical protein ACRDBX_05050 [Erysipelotrichaceae bacterium]
MNMPLLPALLLVLGILCSFLALFRNAILYYYKRNDRLSELEIHYIFKYHRYYGAVGLIALIAHAVILNDFGILLIAAIVSYVLGAIFAMLADRAKGKIIYFHQGFMILALLLMFFQLFS